MFSSAYYFTEMQIRKDELNILLFLNAYFDRINCQLSIVYVKARIFLVCGSPSVDNIKNINLILNGFVFLDGNLINRFGS